MTTMQNEPSVVEGLCHYQAPNRTLCITSIAASEEDTEKKTHEIHRSTDGPHLLCCLQMRELPSTPSPLLSSGHYKELLEGM